MIVGCVSYDYPPDQMDRQLSFVYLVDKPNSFGIPTESCEIKGQDFRLIPIPITGVIT